jgi:hypothetical protein
MLNVTLVVGGKFIEGLVEDAKKAGGENLVGEGGDSGGPWLFIEANNEALMEGTHDGFVPECVKVANKKGPEFFKKQAECSSLEFKEKEGNEGEWERKKAVENLIYMPLKQPVGGAAQGSLEALKLELLTTANEVIPGC